MSKRTVTVHVARHERYKGGPFNFGGYEKGSLSQVINSLMEIKRSIPRAYRASAVCIIDSGTCWDSPSIDISYERPETAEEAEERIGAEQQRQRSTERRERELLRSLQQKFEKADRDARIKARGHEKFK